MNNHPITPPPELVKKWATTYGTHYSDLSLLCQSVATQAARWGADQELEALLELADEFLTGETLRHLRAARRPKPPSLKEQALEELELLRGDANAHGLGFDAPAIRRALKALPDV